MSYFRRTDPADLAYEPAIQFYHPDIRDLVDIDQDGDVDPAGNSVSRNRQFHGPEDGAILQYGTGLPGTGGAVPLIGGTGPFRPGSTTATLRVRDAVGGATSALLIGVDQAAIPGLFLGGTLWVDPILLILFLPLSGTPGEAGQGAIDLPLDGLLDVAAGFPLTFQLVALDGGAFVNKSSTGGLEITFGL